MQSQSIRSLIRSSLDESIAVKERLKDQVGIIEEISNEALDSIKKGGKVVLFGNGGSAADAQHISCELVGKFKLDRVPLPAIALTTNTSILTAIANDIGFEEAFSRQVNGLVTSNDLVIGISTSGESENVIRGILAAKEKGARTIALTGGDGGRLARVADASLLVPSHSTPRIQEAHITVGHIVSEIVERELFGR